MCSVVRKLSKQVAASFRNPPIHSWPWQIMENGCVGWGWGVHCSGIVEELGELPLGNPCFRLLFLMHWPPLAAGGTISLWSINLKGEEGVGRIVKVDSRETKSGEI